MSTIVSWFATLPQARSAVLDLVTGGIPREAISVLTRCGEHTPETTASYGSQLDVGDDADGAYTVNPHDFIMSLFGATTFTIPDIGCVVAAGPLADLLQEAPREASGHILRRALINIGTAPDQAHQHAQQLNQGGALLAVQVDAAQEAIVHGVFRHTLDLSLDDHQEIQGPTPSRELTGDAVGGPVSTSIGALSNGVLPGAWGSANPLPEAESQQIAGDDSLPRRGV